MRLFLDTNIIVDLLDIRRSNSAFSLKVLEVAVFNNFEIAISEDILTTVYYVTKKEIARKKLLSFFEMIDDEFNVLNFKKGVVKKAIKLCQKNGKLDFEDVLQAVCAEKNNCDMIITNDKKFPQLKIPVKNAKDFLKEYNEKK